MIHRRTFLRVLGSTIVGAAFAPQTLLPTPEVSAFPTFSHATTGPLTLDMLRQTYEACTIGAFAPDMAIIAASTARRLGLVYDVDVEDVGEEAS